MDSQLFAFNIAKELPVVSEQILAEKYDPQEQVQVWTGENSDVLASYPCTVGYCSASGGSGDWIALDSPHTGDCECG